MSTDLADRVTTALRCVGHARTVLLAVSGGPDSVALAHLVAFTRPDLDLVVGHVQHGLRNDVADLVAARRCAERIGRPFASRAVTVTAGNGPEDASRRARYRALAEMAEEAGTTCVMTGHTMDDQAETVVLRIARGTGIEGLAAMAALTEQFGLTVIRPLLDVRRSETHAVSATEPIVDDPSNRDPDQRRHRARTEAIPALRRLHPSEADVVPLLARLAGFARATRSGVDPVSEVARGENASWRRFGMAVDVHLSVQDTTRAIALLRQAWAALSDVGAWPGHGLLVGVRGLGVGDQVDVAGGVRMTRLTADRLVLQPVVHPVLPSTDLPAGTWVAVPGFGELRWDPGGDDVGGRRGPGLPREVWLGWSWTVDVTWPATSLRLRGRGQAGDRSARDVLQTFPRPLRRQVPLIVDQTDQVVMAGPVAMDADTSGGRSIRLRARPFDGPAGGGVPPQAQTGYSAGP